MLLIISHRNLTTKSYSRKVHQKRPSECACENVEKLVGKAQTKKHLTSAASSTEGLKVEVMQIIQEERAIINKSENRKKLVRPKSTYAISRLSTARYSISKRVKPN
jgi:hypothetical protein